jgi:hypothetical protein
MPKFKLSEAAEAEGKSVATRVRDKKTGASELVIFDKDHGVEHDIPESAAGPLREQYLKRCWYDSHGLPQPMLVEVPVEKPAPPAPAAPGGAPGSK